jgi:hypothetical protein
MELDLPKADGPLLKKYSITDNLSILEYIVSGQKIVREQLLTWFVFGPQ